MSALAAARYEPQVGLAPAAPALPLAAADPSPRLDHAADDEAASLLPRPAVRRLEPAAKEVSKLRRGFYAYSVASEVRSLSLAPPPLPRRASLSEPR